MSDLAGLFAATVLLGGLLFLSGAAIAAIAGWPGENARSYQWGESLLFALAILPALLSLIARLANVDAALAVQVALALLGITAVRKMQRPPLSAVCGLAACALVVGFELCDWRWGGKLYHATFAEDMAKHAATVNSILSWGLPLTDPFVSRARPAAYYYFFYTVAAMPVRLTLGALNAPAAVGALAVLNGAALLALAVLLWQRCKLPPPASATVVVLLLALLLCGNLDIVANLPQALASHVWPVQIEQWNEQILPLAPSLLWVPHHILALIAGVFGLLLISERPGPPSAIAGGFAFASCFGASVWISFGVALTALLWLVSLAIRRQYRLATALAAAGCLAGVLLIPQIYDLLHGLANDGSPVGPTVRAFYMLDWWIPPSFYRNVLRLVFLPVNYLFEFGVFAVGAVMFWSDRRFAAKTEASRILAFGAIAGLLLGTFTRSTISNNDLGWRVMLLPQLAFLIWTGAVILSGDEKFRITARLRRPGAIGILLLIGYAGTVYQLVIARAYPFLMPNVDYIPHFAVNPEVDDALASAYGWANGHVARDAVLQHNPVGDQRVIDFALYGRNRVAVADSEAFIYGASKAEVKARLAAIGPIFSARLSAPEVQALAVAHGIDVLVVSSADPVWSDRSDWVWSAPVLLASAQVRLVATRDLTADGGVGDTKK